MKKDLAQALIELWEEYLAHRTDAFQPTMTDFIGYIKGHQFGEDVKPDRTDGYVIVKGDLNDNPPTTLTTSNYNGPVTIKASDAQQRLDGPLTKQEKDEIKRLCDDGYSYARVRQMLDLNHVPLSAIISIANN